MVGFLQGFLQFSAELEWIVDLPFKVVAYGIKSLFLSPQFMNVTMLLITVCISHVSCTSDFSFKLISNSQSFFAEASLTILENSHRALRLLS